MPCARGGRRPLAIKEMTNEPAAHATELRARDRDPDGTRRRLGAQPRARSAQPMRQQIELAFMNDLDIVAVGIEHPCRIIAGIVFKPGLRCLLALASGGHSRLIEGVYLGMVFRHKPNMHGLRIGFSFLEPEESSFAVTKT